MRARPFPTLDGFGVADLHDPRRLADLDRLFRDRLAAADPALSVRFERYRDGERLAAPAESALLVDAARHLSTFVAALFGVEAEREALVEKARRETVLFKFRWSVFQRRSSKKYPDRSSVEALDGKAVDAAGDELIAALSPGEIDEELRVATAGFELFSLTGSLSTPPAKDAAYPPGEARTRLDALRARLSTSSIPLDGDDATLLARLTEAFDAYVGRLRFAPIHAGRTRGWPSLFLARPVKPDHLVHTYRPLPSLPEARAGDPTQARARAGFGLTDARKPFRAVTGETHYCLICHEREKDSCSTGFVKKEGGFKTNPLGISLAGCPLDEKISEMHELRRDGDSIGAIALITIDNPMLPGTGHRICNDCMKACIFQNQEPVDIPQVETGVLTETLALPWGFEIWSLLTRWNPLNRKRPFALPYNGRTVLIVGLGPSGYTLAHHLLNDGFGVVAIDGLKIEPLPPELVGDDATPPRPVLDIGSLTKPLDRRPLTGFGGVSEYGITVRWDKNFLDILYLNLARRRTLRIYGGVRFGGNLTLEQGFDLGFDHIAIAAGAGRPTLAPMKQNLMRGVRLASDFLMALQLTGAFKQEALANLHLEVPIVVIGGGLTAIDTATESLAYYAVHVEKILSRFESLTAEKGPDAILSQLSPEERSTLLRQLEHGRVIRRERDRAVGAGETPDFARITKLWGGATVAYRRQLEASPAYRLNHEEVHKALEEGIHFAEGLDPLECLADGHGALRAVLFRRKDGTTVELPCRTLLIAAGTAPNVSYEKEHPGRIPLDAAQRFFASHVARRGEDGTLTLEPSTDLPEAFFTGARYDGKLVTFFGDNHPAYAGNVVKAMASAKHGAPKIRELFAPELDALQAKGFPGQAARDETWRSFTAHLDDLLLARVVRVDRLTPTIVEVIVKAPLAARNFSPGQFYRLQNYEAFAPAVSGAPGERPTPLLIEPCALTGAWVDKEKGLLSMIALEFGVSTRLCAVLEPGERVVVMGPTGSPTHIPENDALILCGGGLGNAVLFSIGRSARERGTRVLYFAGYKKASDFYKREELEASADVIVYSVDVPPEIPNARPTDFTFVGNIVESMRAYAEGRLGATPIPISDASRLIAIGSDGMMAAVAEARRTSLKPYLRPGHEGIGSINSPMQCMMKEVCAQCLQRHVDPVTGKESFVFSCFNQDQNLDDMDWDHLRARLAQNQIEEKMSRMWLDRLMAAKPVPV